MSSDAVHPSATGANTRPMASKADDATQDASLPPQRHAGSVGLGPNYPLGPSLGDKIKGVIEEMEGEVLKKPALVERGRKRRNGELLRKERQRDAEADPFKAANETGK